MNCEWNGQDIHRSQMVKAIQGTWLNMDCPGERYVVTGQNVTRTDAQGSRHFTLQWDSNRKQLQWGTQGRLYLNCVADGAVVWVPSRNDSRAWRWQRLPPYPPARSSTSMPVSSSYNVIGCPAPCRPAQPHSITYTILPIASPQRTVQRTEVPVMAEHYGAWRRQPIGSSASQQWSPYGQGAMLPPSRVDYNHGQRSHYIYRGHGPRFHRRSNDQRLPCGLLSSEVEDLLFRDLTPEDYETLLRLDETVAKPTANTSLVENLPTVPSHKVAGEACSVCLASFEENDTVASLPCRHHFHKACIKKWLSECRTACPLCGQQVEGESQTKACCQSSSSSSTSVGQRSTSTGS